MSRIHNIGPINPCRICGGEIGDEAIDTRENGICLVCDGLNHGKDKHELNITKPCPSLSGAIEDWNKSNPHWTAQEEIGQYRLHELGLMVERWVEDNFDFIPTALINFAYWGHRNSAVAKTRQMIGKLAGGEFKEFPKWPIMFKARTQLLGEFLQQNALAVADMGFQVYKMELSEPYQYIVLGIDGEGYDFHVKHWIPLFCYVTNLVAVSPPSTEGNRNEPLPT